MAFKKFTEEELAQHREEAEAKAKKYYASLAAQITREQNAPPSPALAAFLTALTELSREHGFVIEGCGCCGSPSVELMTERNQHGRYEETDRLEWVAK